MTPRRYGRRGKSQDVMRRQLTALIATAALLLGTGASAADGRAREPDPTLEVRHPHGFSRDEARVRVNQLLDYWAQRFGVQRRWDGDRVRVQGKFWGMDFDGVLVVKDGEVRALANDPGSIFRRTAVDYVNGKLRKYLHPTYEG